MDMYVGIDVAFAKNKYLPVVCSRMERGVLKPLPLREWRSSRPPKGKGNVKIVEGLDLPEFAEDAREYLKKLEDVFEGKIRRIAIDAPKQARPDDCARRACEFALDNHGISCITTPSLSQFDEIRTKARDFLTNGGKEPHLPHANQLWMLAGFELFKKLSEQWDCIEVYPHAIAVALKASETHKSNTEGLSNQLLAVSSHTGWPTSDNPIKELKQIAFGSAHDKLDAYLSSWVASLDDDHLKAIGCPPDDVIWVPSI